MDFYLIADSSSVLASTLAMIWTVIKVLIGLGLVIFVHELGHFLVAKACGVKCEKFYLGFDVPIRIGPIQFPRTLGKIQWGETEYGIGVIPLGGYVKMLGQDDNPANAEKEAERIRVRKEEGEPAEGGSSEAEAASGTAAGEHEDFELDPRSFPAKSVPQRMAIISAGVVMNLIFAMIFGAIAYGVGVKYQPCEISGTTPGSPAWKHNIPARSMIIQLGKQGEETEYLRFDWDLRQYVAYAGMGDQPQPIDLQLRLPDGEKKWVELTPDTRLVGVEENRFATIGVRAAASTTLAKDMPTVPNMSASEASPELEAGDNIVGINGERFDTSAANALGKIPAYELEAALAAHIDETVTLLVERPGENESESTQTLDVELPPNPMKRLGMHLEIGPVLGVQQESPAKTAGFQQGDRIIAVRGEALGDPLLLPLKFRDWIGEEIPVTVERESKESGETTEVELVVRPEPRYRYISAIAPGGLVGIAPIGLAYSVTNTVAAVESESPAAQAGLQPGDVLNNLGFQAATEEAQEQAEALFGRIFNRPIELTTEKRNWPYAFGVIQRLPADVKLELEYTRSGQDMSATLVPAASEKWHTAARGLRLTPLQRVHTATSWSDAWQLGFRETKEQLGRVLNVLGKLVTLQLSPKNLGGPVMIAAVAGSEASQGIPRLLIFLTFLSANLAILNFLPIPALDGGHMVFLAAEGVTGKPVDERLQGTLTLIGVMALLALMIFVFANDIGRLFL